MFAILKEKLQSKQSISRAEAEWLYQNGSLEQISNLATLAKSHYHSTTEATYLIMAIVNYTNICVAACDYCAFYKLPHQEGAYLRSYEDIRKQLLSLRALGGTMAGFNGGFHPKLKLQNYADFFQKLHSEFSDMTFYEMTVAEFMFSCKLSKLDYASGAQILKNAGTQWITGGGAEILTDSFRQRHSPGKFKVEDYYKAQAAILNSGLNSTATMVIGFDESIEERFDHLELLRHFQNEQIRKLPSFLCWTYKPFNNKLGGQEISTEEYLRWLGISRIYLDNFEHIRTSVLSKNHDALLGLNFGANDFDLPVEDEVMQKAGASISLDFDSILTTAKNLGFKTIKRNAFQTRNDIHFIHTQTYEERAHA